MLPTEMQALIALALTALNVLSAVAQASFFTLASIVGWKALRDRG